MSMEMMKKVLVGAIGVAIYSFSGSAQAACNTTTADQWECLQAETSANVANRFSLDLPGGS